MTESNHNGEKWCPHCKLQDFSINIGNCNGQPGQYVNALVDQKTKERTALMNPTN